MIFHPVIDPGETLAYTQNHVRVEWVRLGEGYFGDYDPDNPDDLELLRFDVSVYDPDDPNEWVDPGDASYCTLIPADSPESLLVDGLKYIMNAVYEPLMYGHSIKKICEELSWIAPSWLRRVE